MTLFQPLTLNRNIGLKRSLLKKIEQGRTAVFELKDTIYIPSQVQTLILEDGSKIEFTVKGQYVPIDINFKFTIDKSRGKVTRRE